MDFLEKIYSKIISCKKPLFLVGSDKNSGKTTVLNALMRQFSSKNESCNILSCGMDGEEEDSVFRTEKPPIRVNNNDLFVTTWNGTCDLPVKLVSTLPFSVSGNRERLGIWKAEGVGDIILNGGLSVSQVWEIINKLNEVSDNLIFIDGALDRWSALFGGESVFILVAGGKSFSTVYSAGKWLKEKLDILGLPVTANEFEVYNYEKLLNSEILPDSVKFDGALTYRVAREIISKGVSKLTVKSPSHIFCTLKHLEKLQIFVEHNSLPIGIAVNPEKIGNSQFSSRDLVSHLSEIAEDIPVFDILTL